MVAAFDADIPLTEGRVHESAVMRRRRIGVNMVPKVAAAHAHALDRDGAGVLEPLDHRDQGHQKMLLVRLRQRARHALQGTGSPAQSAALPAWVRQT